MKILFNDNPLALWYDVIYEAEKTSAISLKTDLESYLVFLLARYANKPEIVQRIMATEFLQGLKLKPSQRQLAFQAVGDNCLIYSGLFPKLSEKRQVKISYFINIGQNAYRSISQTKTDIYGLLSAQFVALMDVLQSIRCYSHEFPDLLPLEAYDLWDETGSKRALHVLQQYTSCQFPTRIDSNLK